MQAKASCRQQAAHGSMRHACAGCRLGGPGLAANTRQRAAVGSSEGGAQPSGQAACPAALSTCLGLLAAGTGVRGDLHQHVGLWDVQGVVTDLQQSGGAGAEQVGTLRTPGGRWWQDAAKCGGRARPGSAPLGEACPACRDGAMAECDAWQAARSARGKVTWPLIRGFRSQSAGAQGGSDDTSNCHGGPLPLPNPRRPPWRGRRC